MKKKINFFDVCVTIIMALLVLCLAYPLYYTVIASFSGYEAIATGKVAFFPVGFNVNAYKHVFAYKDIWIGYFNSAIYTLLGTVLGLTVTIPAAYALSKEYYPKGKVFSMVFLFTMYFGGGMIPTYITVKNLGLLNTRAVLVVMGCFSVYNMIVARTYFKTSIPESLYEAAEIDGAGEIRKFFAIALPLAKPIIAVITLYLAVDYWNDYRTALIYTTDKALEPLQSVLRRVVVLNERALDASMLEMEHEMQMGESLLQLNLERSRAAYVMKYAVVFIGSLPLLIIYPFIQKYFVKGVMVGSVKG